MDDLKKRRFLAGFIDLMCIPFVIFFTLGTLHRAPVPNVILIVIGTVWLIVRDLFDGAGPGKRLYKLKVIHKETGKTLDKKDIIIALYRNLLIAIPFFFSICFVIEAIVLFRTGERLGDKWAKTAVVDASK
jgi:uncharacterized RDD family membrane protein YckC